MNYTTKYILALIVSAVGFSAANVEANQCAPANSIEMEDLLRANTQTPIFLTNRSSIAMIANYWYDGKEVIQLIPAGKRVPLGLWNKIEFRSGREPRVYRYNDFGAMIFGKGYKAPFNISYNEFIKNKPCGNAITNRSVIELSFSVSSFFNSGLSVQVLVHPGYNLSKDDGSAIFPNYSASFLRNIFTMSSMEDFLLLFGDPSARSTAAKAAYYAKQLLNLPDEFTNNITVAKAVEHVQGAAQALSDVTQSGLWLKSDYDKESILNAIKTAQNTLLDIGVIVDTNDDPRFDVGLIGLR